MIIFSCFACIFEFPRKILSILSIHTEGEVKFYPPTVRQKKKNSGAFGARFGSNVDQSSSTLWNSQQGGGGGLLSAPHGAGTSVRTGLSLHVLMFKGRRGWGKLLAFGGASRLLGTQPAVLAHHLCFSTAAGRGTNTLRIHTGGWLRFDSGEEGTGSTAKHCASVIPTYGGLYSIAEAGSRPKVYSEAQDDHAMPPGQITKHATDVCVMPYQDTKAECHERAGTLLSDRILRRSWFLRAPLQSPMLWTSVTECPGAQARHIAEHVLSEPPAATHSNLSNRHFPIGRM